MATVLRIDSSPRRARSHTRKLTQRFVDRWLELHPDDGVVTRDVGLEPPPLVTEAWVAAAYTNPEARTPEMWAALAVSEVLVDEFMAADLIVMGIPMYNFGMPAAMKAYIDQIVRVGRTFGFDRNREGELYWPMVENKPLVVLSARGDAGFNPGEPNAWMNHMEPHVEAVMSFIGITDITSIAIENEEFKGERLAQSLRTAEEAVDRVAAQMAARKAA